MASITTINPTPAPELLLHQNKIDLHNLPTLSHTAHLQNLRTSPGCFNAPSGMTSDESSSPTHGVDLYSTNSSSKPESSSKNINSTAGALHYIFPNNGENGNGIGSSSSSQESIANLLDEGLGTSLDGMEETVTTTVLPLNSALGRNDSGVFSGDETSATLPQTDTPIIESSNTKSNDSPGTTILINQEDYTNQTESTSHAKLITSSPKKNRPRNSSPNRQGPQRCLVCGKTFSNASALTKHKLTHSDERKHACTMCGKAFKRQDHLNGHMLTHRNKKPFECSAKGCGKSYCDARSLRRHVESRHGSEAGVTLPIRSTNEGARHKSNSSSSKQSCKGAKKSKKSENTSATGVGKMKTVEKIDTPLACANFSDFELNTVGDNNSSLTGTGNLLSITEKCNGSSGSTSNVGSGSKYVMVKLKDEYFLGSAVDEDEILRNNNNSILISPETMATILSCANSANTINTNNSLTKDIILNISKNPISCNDGQSQLHQLLTQCVTAKSPASSAGITLIPNTSISSDPTLTTQPLLNISPGALHNELGGAHILDWSGHHSEQISESSSNLLPPLTRPGGFDGNCYSAENEIIGPGGRKSSEALLSPSVQWNKNGKPTTTIESNISTTSINSPLSSPSYSAPNLLKEQLELIHQIIQQAHEESIISNCSTSLVPKIPKGKKSLSKMVHSNNESTSSLDSLSSKSKIESSSYSTEDPSTKSSSTTTLGEGKLVECTICYRKFKNTPALNGHMRLHGGYFKGGAKETESKRKDSSNKESTNTPLQTASVSVRALIEEKIIQKRNTNASSNTAASQGLDGTNIKPGIVKDNSLKSPIPCGFLYETQLTPESNLMINSNSTVVAESCNPKTAPLLTVSPSTFKTEKLDNASDNLGVLPHSTPTAETFQFIFSQDQDQSDYLLMEEEVFNKVSSICPDSFLNGLDDSFLTGESNGDDLVGADWTWPTTAESKLNLILKSCTESESNQYIVSTNESMAKGAVCSETFGTMPSLDSNSLFYASPAPKSPSIHSQDSPSFIYPTPPASLESHNAIQSPHFPSNSSSGSINLTCPGTSKMLYQYDSQLCLKIPNNNNPATVVNMMEVDQDAKLRAENISLLSDSFSLDTTVPSSLNSSETLTYTPKTVQGKKPSVGAYMSSGETNGTFLTPSCSPNLTGIGPEESSSSKLTKELKLNEPSRMDCSMSFTEGIPLFLNPNSVSYSPVKSSTIPTKRKHVRNTFASNLRPSPSSSSNCSHFTPYPILSPVRSAPGLYWTFSTKLSHVDDTRREKPRINIGYNFQATNLPNPILGISRKRKQSNKNINLDEDDDQSILKRRENGNYDNGMDGHTDDSLWDPSVMKNCSLDEVEKYLEFACCSAVPGGGRNKEFALHLLNYTKGDITAAILLLMNPSPALPSHLANYKYPEVAKWTREEINLFQESLLRHGKDFLQISNEIKTKCRRECTIFYQLWKKVCQSEYEQVRNVWKKRDANFTLELLKTVPPPESISTNLLKQAVLNKLIGGHIHNNDDETVPKLSDMDEYILSDHLHSNPLTKEEFPCKVCGKIFHKVKSRSAHMKSHRPPDSPNLTLEISANSLSNCVKKTKLSKPTIYKNSPHHGEQQPSRQGIVLSTLQQSIA